MGRTKMWRGALYVFSVVVLGLADNQATGAELTFSFSGTITTLSDPGNLLNGAVSVGTPFSGHYTFDPNVNDSSANVVARYASVGEDYEYVVNVGGYTFSRNGNDGFPGIPIYVSDGLQDAYAVNTNMNVSAAPGVPPTVTNVRSHIQLIDGDGTAFSSVALPLVPPALSSFNDAAASPNVNLNEFAVRGLPPTGSVPLFSFSGPLTQLVVPEPSGVALACLAGYPLLLRRRQQ